MRLSKAYKVSRANVQKAAAVIFVAGVCAAGSVSAGNAETLLSGRNLSDAPIATPLLLANAIWQYSSASYRSASGSLGTYWTMAKTVDPIQTSSVPASFFGTVAIPFAAINVREQWNRVRSQSLPLPGACANSKCSSRVEAFRNAVAIGKRKNFAGKLDIANRTANTLIAYQSDRATYASVDHWASAKETIQRGAGDCEDFAILKLTLLRAMGVPDKSLSIIILRDNSRNLYHSVLGVSTNQGHLILDNVRGQVFRDTQVSNYQPLYSLSGSRSWIHGTKAGKSALTAKLQVPLDNVAPGESAAAPVLSIATTPLDFSDLRPSVQY